MGWRGWQYSLMNEKMALGWEGRSQCWRVHWDCSHNPTSSVAQREPLFSEQPTGERTCHHLGKGLPSHSH